MSDLQSYIEWPHVECLNQKPDKQIGNALKQVNLGVACQPGVLGGRGCRRGLSSTGAYCAQAQQAGTFHGRAGLVTAAVPQHLCVPEWAPRRRRRAATTALPNKHPHKPHRGIAKTQGWCWSQTPMSSC